MSPIGERDQRRLPDPKYGLFSRDSRGQDPPSVHAMAWDVTDVCRFGYEFAGDEDYHRISKVVDYRKYYHMHVNAGSDWTDNDFAQLI